MSTPVTWKDAYKREVMSTKANAARFLLGADVLVGGLVGSLLYVAFSSGGGGSFKEGMSYAAIIACIPAVVGIAMAHSAFMMDQSVTLSALRNLGLSHAKIRDRLRLQFLISMLSGTLAATILGLPILWVLLKILFIGVDTEFPQRWGDWYRVAPASLLVLAVMNTIAYFATSKKTPEMTGATLKREEKRGRGFGRALGYVGATANIVLGVYLLIQIGNGLLVTFFLITVPFLTFAIAPPLTSWMARAVARVTTKNLGWKASTVGIYSISRTGTLRNVALISLLVSIPLAAFTWANVSAQGGKIYSAQQLSEAPVLAPTDGGLFTPTEAREHCTTLAEACGGIVWWQPVNIDYGQAAVPADLDKASSYALGATEPEVLETVLSGQKTPPDQLSYFNLDVTILFEGTIASAPSPDGGLVVLSNTERTEANDIAGARSIAANKWALNSDTDLLYGPHGDGTNGFIPLFAYTLLAISVILLVIFTGRKRALAQFFSPLLLLGATQQKWAAAQCWTLGFPFIGAVVAAFLSTGWYAFVGINSFPATSSLTLPSMPIGIWILVAFVAVVSSSVPLFSKVPKELTMV